MTKKLTYTVALCLALALAGDALAKCDPAAGWTPGVPCRDADQVGLRTGSTDVSLQDAYDAGTLANGAVNGAAPLASTIASLPACTDGIEGTRRQVTDALTDGNCATGGGTAVTTCECRDGVWQADKSRGDAFPGVSGTHGNEATLAALLDDSRNVPAMPDGPVYYFSCDAGGLYPLGTALGPGTRAAPFLNFAQARFVAREGVTLRFDTEPTNCFTVATADVIDFSTPRPAGDPTPILRLDSAVPGVLVKLTQTSAPSPGIIHIHDTTAGGSPELAGGTVIVQDLWCSGHSTACWITDDGVDLVTNRIRCDAANGTEDCARAAGSSKAFMWNTLESTSFDGAFFFGQEWSHLTAIGKSKITMSSPGSTASVGLVDMQASAGIDNAAAGIPFSMTIIGHQLDIPASSSGTKQIVRLGNSAGADGAIIRLDLARVVLSGADFGTSSCLRSVEAANRAIQISAHQVTFANCDQVIEIPFTADTPPVRSDSLHRIRYSLVQPGAGVSRLLDINNGATTTAGTFDVRYNFVHQHGGAVTNWIRWRRSDTSQETTTTIANFLSGMAGEPEPYATVLSGLFPSVTTVTSTASLPTDDQFNGSGYRCTDAFNTPTCALPSTPSTSGSPDGICDDAATFECARLVETYVCDPTEECYRGLSEAYSKPVWIPALVTGSAQDVTTLDLVAQNYGAR